MSESDQNPPASAETRTTIQTLRDPGLIHVILKDGAAVNLDDAIENHAATIHLVGSRQVLILVDPRPARSITREARVEFADPKARGNTIAQAIMVDSGPSRVMGNFFIGLNKPRFPTRLFTAEEAALEWLEGFRP